MDILQVLFSNHVQLVLSCCIILFSCLVVLALINSANHSTASAEVEERYEA